MVKVYNITFRKEINGEKVPNDDKIFSIYEQYTDIIVKGQREVLFGHNINLAAGKSNLVLDCQVLRGKPADKSLYKQTIDKVIQNYEIIPRDSATDGGYACLANIEHALKAVSGLEMQKIDVFLFDILLFFYYLRILFDKIVKDIIYVLL